jgi:hypothetical protein
MKVVVVWWDLRDTGQTVASLRESLQREGTEAWASVEGLRHKYWISDPVGERWGAVMVWDSEQDAEAARRRGLPPNRAAELIGCPPALRLEMDVEAAVAGLAAAAGTADEERTWL